MGTGTRGPCEIVHNAAQTVGILPSWRHDAGQPTACGRRAPRRARGAVTETPAYGAGRNTRLVPASMDRSP